MSIIDKRTERSTQSADNRQKFIERYKSTIKKKVEGLGEDSTFQDIVDKDSYEIDIHDTNEYEFTKDYENVIQDQVLTGNKQFNKGDQIDTSSSGSDSRGGNEEMEHDPNVVRFKLTKEEFWNIYFEDMELPNFIKESLATSTEFKMKRAGYEKQGTPSRLDLKKTFEMATMRKICSESDNPPFLDDIDLRYKRLEKVPNPIKQAVMFLCLDVSGSMSKKLRNIAKKFFLLLYIFLTKTYEKIDIRFIVHSEKAVEVSEEEFFNEQLSGGTILSSPLKLVQEILDTDYKGKSINIYVSHATDGDNWEADDSIYFNWLDKILNQVQFYTYLETNTSVVQNERAYKMYNKMSHLEQENLAKAQIVNEEDVLVILKQIFKKETK